MNLRPLLYDALIVPSAHTRVFDAKFQLEVYEVFHTHSGTRWLHMLCTPIVNIALLTMAATMPFIPVRHFAGFTFDGAVVASLIALVLYVAVHGAAALVMIPVLALSIAVAHMIGPALGSSVVPVAFAIAYAAVFLQTLSHTLEPVPPPWSGSYRWITLKEFLFRTPPLKVAGLTLVSVAVFPILEFWAAPRIWPVQFLHLMMRAGLRPALKQRTQERVREIFDDARKGWALPKI